MGYVGSGGLNPARLGAAGERVGRVLKGVAEASGGLD